MINPSVDDGRMAGKYILTNNLLKLRLIECGIVNSEISTTEDKSVS